MPNHRILLAFLLLSTSAFAQNDCPELPSGIALVPDVETVHVDDLGSLVIYPYFNDSLPNLVGNWEIFYDDFNIEAPDCFGWVALLARLTRRFRDLYRPIRKASSQAD